MTIVENDGVLEREFFTRTYELGSDGKVSLANIANYLQETAGSHARALDLSHARFDSLGITWVMSRQRVVMNSFPGMYEPVTVRTWPSGIESHSASRDFEILDQNGTVIGAATTEWLMMELANRTLIPMPDFISEMAPIPRGRVIEYEGRAIPRVKKPELTTELIVRPTDFDLNGHINHVHYMEWALDVVPEEVKSGYAPCDIEVMYRNEYRDRLPLIVESSAIAGVGDPAFLHSIKRSDDLKEVARLRSRWAMQG